MIQNISRQSHNLLGVVTQEKVVSKVIPNLSDNALLGLGLQLFQRAFLVCSDGGLPV